MVHGQWVAKYYGQFLLDRGEHQPAEELLRPQWEFCRDCGVVVYELDLLPPLGESYVKLERLEEAHACLEPAREILAMPEDWRGLVAGVGLLRALLAAAEEHWEEAEAAFRKAVETYQQYGLSYDQARGLYQWGVSYLERNSPGDRNRGLEILDRSLALFQRCEAKDGIERVIARKGLLTA